MRFTVTDTAAVSPSSIKEFSPICSRKGVAVWRTIGPDGVFQADEVLAKHDENYMPPEAGEALDKAKHAREASKSVIPN